ncbi:MAG: ACT domain-containing protein [Phycisphaerae bacterium]|nr:ACT domain-containing protein [Phycisphaerae bacterium]
MSVQLDRVDIWVVPLEDRPGALASKLASVEQAGANLDFIIVRPEEYQLGNSVLFVAPIVGPEQAAAAEAAGFRKAASVHTLRITAPNRPRLAVDIAQVLSDAGINIMGLTGSSVGDRAALYVRLLSEMEIDRAIDVLTPKLS